MRSSNRKKLFLLLSLLIACLLGTPTGILPGSAQEALQVMVWDWSPDVNEALEKALRECGEAYGIEVELSLVPFEDYWEKLYVSFEAGAAPDLFWVNREMLERLAEGGMIIPLDEFVHEFSEVIEGIPPEALEQFMPYGIPVGSSGDFVEVAYAIADTSKYPELAFELIRCLRIKAEFPPAGVSIKGCPDPDMKRFDFTSPNNHVVGSPPVLYIYVDGDPHPDARFQGITWPLAGPNIQIVDQNSDGLPELWITAGPVFLYFMPPNDEVQHVVFTLEKWASGPTLRAYDKNANIVATAVSTTAGGVIHDLHLKGQDITSVEIDGDEILIYQVCYFE